MPNSFATTAQLTCPACRHSFQADVWLIVDSSERPDLLEQARSGTIHSLACPHCEQTSGVDAPLLLHRPELLTSGLSDTPLIFAASGDAEAADDAATQLLGMLRDSLGVQWRDSWLRDVPGLPADFALSGDRRPALESSLLRLLGDFINADTWNASRRIVEEHPELLGDEADELLVQLIDAQNDEQSRRVVTEHRTLLRRCREIGAAAFAEHTSPSPGRGEGRGGGEEIPAELQAILRQLSRPARLQEMPQRIALCQRALQLIARAQNPPLWAALQNNLANSLNQNPLGPRAENIEQAIGHYSQALAVYTREAFSEQWAATQNNLATAYSDRIRGERGENIEQAIGHCRQALAVYTREAFPEQWAMTQNNLANAYSDRIRGERGENIEQAIGHYRQALAVYTREAFPEQWAATQNNLAAAYFDRIRGERAENIEQAISHYSQALVVYSREAFPVDWAMTQNNLATAYSNRIRGERAENIEEAISHYSQALAVYSREVFPEQWAGTQNNLATTYRNRIRGERAENIEEAISHYSQALAVRTREAFPADWAMTQNNLALAYFDRIRGERAENIEEAISHYSQALAVRTREAFPEQWAATQNNLAAAYSYRIRGEKAENIEEAISHYSQALAVRTREAFPEQWAMTQNNLAMVYFGRIRGERGENIEQAIGHYSQALAVYTREAFPELNRQTARSLAHLFFGERRWDEASIHLADVLDSTELLYQAAATPEVRESELGQVAGIPQQLAFALTRADSSQAALQRAVVVLDTNRARWLAEALDLRGNKPDAVSPSLWQRFQAEAESVRLLQIESQLQENTPGKRPFLALTGLLGQARRILSQTVDEIRNSEPDFMPAPSFARIAAALTPRPPLPQTGEGEVEPLPSPPQTGEGAVGGAQEEGPSSIRPSNNPSPRMGEAGRGYLVYLLATPAGGLALVVHRDDGPPSAVSGLPSVSVTPVWLDGLTEDWVRNLLLTRQNEEIVGGYLAAYFRNLTERNDAARQGWFAALDDACRQLWDVAMAPLAGALMELDGRGRASTEGRPYEISNTQYPLSVTLIPTGFLGLLPLHAAWTETLTPRPPLPSAGEGESDPSVEADAGGSEGSAPSPRRGEGRGEGSRRYFLDDFAVSYAASATSLGHSQARAGRAAAERLLAVAEPLPVSGPPLPDARREVAAIAELFSPAPVLAGGDATRTALLAGLPHADVFHFSGHGNTAWGDPLESTLWCAGNEPLTVRDILAQRLPGARLAVLSACETGIPGRQLPDETVNLPSALVQAGFAGAVASLWSVYDISTAMLLVCFYQHWRVDGQQLVDALRAAQLWLRDTTNREKAAFFGQFVPGLQQRMAGQVGAEFFVALHNRDEGLDDRSFAHPVHWAAFTLTGV